MINNQTEVSETFGGNKPIVKTQITENQKPTIDWAQQLT